MQLVAEQTSLVIAGAWNAAILTPEWVLKHALGREGEEQIQVFFPAGPRVAIDAPRFVLKDFNYSVRPDSLVIALPDASPEMYSIAQEAVARMLDILAHTPVGGVGHNFVFRDDEPSVKDLQVFSDARRDLGDHMPAELRAAASTLSTSYERDDGGFVVNITRAFDGSALSVSFNFHHPIESVDQAKAVLRGDGFGKMEDNLRLSQELLDSIYGGSNG